MKTIMIVDNEQSFHNFYYEMLKDTDYEVISAYDCCEALDKLREHQPDLMIIDDLIFMDIVLNRECAGDRHLNGIKSQSEDDYVPFIKTSDLILQSYKNLKSIAPELLFPDVSFTREKIIEEINARIGDKVKLLI
jgi:CheY-like chemotaxis protein